MDRLNRAASTKVSSLLEEYSKDLAHDISTHYGLDFEVLTEDIERLTRTYFAKDHEEGQIQACAWFTKRGEPCHKDRKLGHEFCSTHAEYFLLHTEEVNHAKSCPEVVNVTRRGICKTSHTHATKAFS